MNDSRTLSILTEFLRTPWAILPEALNAFAFNLARYAAGEPVTARRNRSTAIAPGTIAVVPVYGIITQRGDLFDAIFGGGSVSTQQLAATLRQLQADDNIGAIVLDVDSPGGSVYGVAELAEEIFAARGGKKIVAVADSLAASAAYWIASAADEMIVTPTGEAGSIGVYAMHQDISGALEKFGVKVSLIAAGKYKTEGSPYAPLDDEARAHMQARVEDYYQMFIKAVARNRKDTQTAVREGYGQGRVLGAEDAVKANLADGIATLDEMLKKLSRQAKASASSAGKSTRLAAARRELSILS